MDLKNFKKQKKKKKKVVSRIKRIIIKTKKVTSLILGDKFFDQGEFLVLEVHVLIIQKQVLINTIKIE